MLNVRICKSLKYRESVKFVAEHVSDIEMRMTSCTISLFDTKESTCQQYEQKTLFFQLRGKKGKRIKTVEI